MSNTAEKPIGRILISNDDGIDAIGIRVLREIASHLCDDIWVIAPSENRSGASRSITLRRDVAIEETAPKFGNFWARDQTTLLHIVRKRIVFSVWMEFARAKFKS